MFFNGAPRYKSRYFGGDGFDSGVSFAAARTIEVSAGRTVEDISVYLYEESASNNVSFSGTVTRSGGTPLSNIAVQLLEPYTNTPIATTTTAANGSYSLTSERNRSVLVRFAPAAGSGYAGEYYDDRPGSLQSTPLSSSTNLTGIDAELAAGGSIGGTVTDAATGRPAANVTLQIVVNNNVANVADIVTTNGSGVYTSHGLHPGSYTVRAERSGGYLPSTVGTAATVASGAAATANLSLTRGATLSGRVVVSGTAEVIEGAMVALLRNMSFTPIGPLTVGGDGRFSFVGLDAGDYSLSVVPAVGQRALKIGYSANSYSLTAGESRDLGDVGLAQTIEIGGRVTDGVSGAPIAGVAVCIQQPAIGIFRTYTTFVTKLDCNTQFGWTRLASVITDADGYYSYRPDLVTGNLRVWVPTTSLAYAPQFYGGATLSSDAPLVLVSDGATRDDINFALQPGGMFAGTVTGTGGAAATVYGGVLTPDDLPVAPLTFSGNSYTSLPAHIPPGQYKLRFGSTDTQVRVEYDGGARTLNAAPAISLTNGQTITVDEEPGPSDRYTVQVSDTAGQPLSTINTFAYPAPYVSYPQTSLIDGVLTIVKQTLAQLKIGLTSTNVAPLFYERSSTINDGNWIVPNAASTALAPMTIAAPGTVRGTITSADGTPMISAGVQAFSPSGAMAWAAQTDISGHYELPLPPGSYRLRAETGFGSPYMPIFSGSAKTWQATSQVVVTSGTTTSIDMVLPRVGRAAQISIGGSAQPTGGTIQVYDQLGVVVDSRSVYDSTVQTAPLLGAYRIGYTSPALGFEQFVGGGQRLSDARPVTVTLDLPAAYTIDIPATGRLSVTNAPADQIGTIIVYDPAGSELHRTSASDATANAIRLVPGSYKIELRGGTGSLRSTFIGGPSLASAEVITIAADATVARSFSFAPAGTIAGCITDGLGGVVGAGIDLILAGGDAAIATSNGDPLRSTDTAGCFSIGEVAPGTYRLKLTSTDEHVSGYYGGATIASATPVVVGSGQTQTIAATLARGATISGHIGAIDDERSVDSEIQVYDADGALVRSVGIDADMAYGDALYAPFSVRGLAPGSYRLRAVPMVYGLGGVYRPTFYGGATLANATPIVVSGATDVRGVTIDLVPGGNINGMISTADGGFVKGMALIYDASGALVNSRDLLGNSFRSAAMPAGVYRVCFDGPQLGRSCYGGQDLARATPVTVTLERDTPIFPLLTPSYSVAGTVRGTGGAALADVTVNLLGADGAVFVSARTGADGNYARTAPTGDYRLQFVAGGASGGYIGGFYATGGVASTGGAVRVGTQDAARDVTLTLGARFSGTYGGAAGASVAAGGIAGVVVSVYDASGAVVTGAVSGADGSYLTAPAVVPGSYRLGFIPPAGSGLLPSFYPAASTLAGAQPIAAEAGISAGRNIAARYGLFLARVGS